MKRKLTTKLAATVFVLGFLAACNHYQKAGPRVENAPPEAKAASNSKNSERRSVLTHKYMVASANPHASRAALEILRAGGSATDAAIAAQMVLNVVEPQSSGIGGGAFLMHYSAKSGAIDAYDGREKAPASAKPNMFLRADGSRRKFHDVAPGGLSVGVPGLLRMLELAHKKHGKLPWKQLFQPAIKIAEGGFKVSPRLNKLINRDRHLKKFPTTTLYFHNDNGKAKSVGQRLVNKDLARTFRLIANNGADAFYKGAIAKDIVGAVRRALLNPGAMTMRDLAAYDAKRRDPVCSLYRTWIVCGMPPPTSGGITTLQILGILQGSKLASMQPGSAEAVHMIAEASKLAFADRNQYLADSDFVKIPIGRLIDPGYLANRARLISPRKAMKKAKPGKVNGKSANKFSADEAEKGLSTTHISIVDGDGNAVSMTSSIENAFGSRVMVRGFLLNNQLTDFSFRPTVKGKPVANRVAPGKRPRSSMSPTLVIDGSGKLVLAVGTPGGSRIIGYVAKTIIAALDWKMDIQEALNMPHFVNRNGATDLEEKSGLESLKTKLEALGHKVRLRAMTSGLHAIRVTKDGLRGAADPRREGVVLGD